MSKIRRIHSIRKEIDSAQEIVQFFSGICEGSLVTVCAEPTLLNASDGPAVVTENAEGASPFLIVCDHASNRIPASLGTLGLETEVLESHVAWDPGAYAVTVRLARQLDAPLVSSGFSRLVYDVNRPIESPDATRSVSEIYDIPGNHDLGEAAREARAQALYHPFHDEIAALISARGSRGQPTVLVTLHSFNPVYNGKARDVELGILHDADSRFADCMLLAAAGLTKLKTGRNQPYGPEDGVTHTLVKHAIHRGLLNVMIEIRNDLIREPGDQANMADMVANMLRHAFEAARVGAVEPLEPGGRDAPGD